MLLSEHASVTSRLFRKFWQTDRQTDQPTDRPNQQNNQVTVQVTLIIVILNRHYTKKWYRLVPIHNYDTDFVPTHNYDKALAPRTIMIKTCSYNCDTDLTLCVQMNSNICPGLDNSSSIFNFEIAFLSPLSQNGFKPLNVSHNSIKFSQWIKGNSWKFLIISSPNKFSFQWYWSNSASAFVVYLAAGYWA